MIELVLAISLSLTPEQITELKEIKPILCKATQENNVEAAKNIIESSSMPFKDGLYSRITCGYRSLDGHAIFYGATEVKQYYETLLGRKTV